MKILEEIAPISNLIVGLADSKEEIFELQKFRYQKLVLDYNENKELNGIDASEYDYFCDHLIVKDTLLNKIVGTYRLMTKEQLKYAPEFLSEKEFDIQNLKNCEENILELGRAVVDEEYRNGVVIKMLWRGIFAYCEKHNVRYMFGMASFHGVDYENYKNAFSLLHYDYLADENVMCYAKEPYIDLNLLKKEQIDMNLYKLEMPSLIKGYLALGSEVGKGVYLDKEFNSADVLMIFDMKKLNWKYANRVLLAGGAN